MHLTSVHRPEDPRIFLKEATSLASAGYVVTIVAGEAPAYRDASKVNFVGVTQGQGHSYIRDPQRGLGARLRRLMTTSLRVWRTGARLRADIYHFHDPELLPMALLLKAAGTRVIYDAHEDLPKQILDKRYIPSGVRRGAAALIGAFERMTAHLIDGVVTATPAIARRFPTTKTAVVQNFPLLGELVGTEAYGSRRRTVCFVGGLTEERGYRELLAAARLLGDQPEPPITIAGRLKPAAFEAEAEAEPNVSFMGWRDRTGVSDVLNRARAGIVTFHPTANYVEAYPIKMFEYMSAGLPVIASNFPLWREIIEGANVGLLVDPLDPRQIAEAIEWIFAHEAEAEQMGERGRMLVAERFNWDLEASKLLALYRRVGPRV